MPGSRFDLRNVAMSGAGCRHLAIALLSYSPNQWSTVS